MNIVERLTTIYSNYSLGLFAFCMLNRLTPEKIKTSDKVIIGEDGLYCVPPNKDIPSEVKLFYEATFGGSSTFNLNRATMEFAKMLLRNLTIDSYETLFNYCEDTAQLSQLQAQSWYRFARMIRNSLTHTQHWRFSPRDLARLPVQWKDKQIETEMNGQEMTFDFYDWWDGCELWNEMLTFAKTLK